jgi:hypothetical protein
MATMNLRGMNVDALLSLRAAIDKKLGEMRSELEQQLSRLGLESNSGGHARGARLGIRSALCDERAQGGAEVPRTRRRNLGGPRRSTAMAHGARQGRPQDRRVCHQQIDRRAQRICSEEIPPQAQINSCRIAPLDANSTSSRAALSYNSDWSDRRGESVARLYRAR